MRPTIFTALAAAALFAEIAQPAAAQIAEAGDRAHASTPAAAVPAVAARAERPKRLPLLGAMTDVGVPDGLIGSLAVRPWSWLRLSAGGGSNGISFGWRTGVTVLPLGTGLSASLEYGRYRDGDANGLSKKMGLGSSPVLERVGYEFMNAHLGMDFGLRRCVGFVHAGVTMLRGQVHNLDASIHDAGAGNAGTTVTVRQDPDAKAVGFSMKLGLIVYIW